MVIREKAFIKVHTTFEGVHCYPIAPEGVVDLQHHHRHIFHVRMKVSVNHLDRELEFFLVKHQIDIALRERYYKESDYSPAYFLGAKSCEMIAVELYHSLERLYKLDGREVEIEVSEDDNNSAIVVWTPQLP